MASAPKVIRCAIYTRKSSEEGLEQDFNSLDAQREACEAYIKSQKHEGWSALPEKYDDGGYSGGTLERPALDDLLTHIKQKKIDVVVVYKIDRLTRSLFDFSKIVEVFDAGGVSFVSVTQQFNTTTSMGRLTLNVLLSFAQFEREVTGERIRDKIAASKRKGMWMGGFVPYGYRVEKRELLIQELEASSVRRIYELYLELGTVRALKGAVDDLGLTNRPSAKSPAQLFAKGYLYRILTNPIYMGKVSHKGVLSDGLHKAIIAPEVWQQVQSKLIANNARERDQPNAAIPSPLAGLIFDEAGDRITPIHAVKGGRRYRYYVSSILLREPETPSGVRISAPEIESAICRMLHDLLGDPRQAAALDPDTSRSLAETKTIVEMAATYSATLRMKTPYEQLLLLKPAIDKVGIGPQQLTLSLHRYILLNVIDSKVDESAADAVPLTIACSARIGRRGRETRLILQPSSNDQRQADPALVALIAKGYTWRHQLVSGQAASVRDIASREKITESYVSRVIDLGFLAPDILAAIVEGRAPVDLTANKLRGIPNIPLDWPSQRQVLGFSN